MPAPISPVIKLANGVEIPQVGLGVYEAGAGGEAEQAVRWALDAGYRHIDTARIYGNEADVGRAVRASGIPREQIFVTTKLWNADHGKDKVGPAFDASLARLGLEYVDLYLVHWPVERLRGESWAVMTNLLAAGKCRAIGVSNYTVRHLEELLATSDVVPTVNQVELSPFLQQRELLAFCRQKGVVVEAYSPLVKAERMGHPEIVKVARKLGRSPAQILVRWSLQHGLVVIPKSVKRARIEENFAVFDFEIGEDDMRALDALEEGHRTSWDPTDVP